MILFLFRKGNLFNLKFAAKELERSAKKCEKDSVNEKLKLKRVIVKQFQLITQCEVAFNRL